jgi:Arm DNA-binding domain
MEKSRTRKPAALTHRTLEAMKPEDDAYRVPDARCVGLAARVASSGIITWDFSYGVRGAAQRTRRLSLGRFPTTGFDDARRRANELRGAGQQGRDLLADEAAANARRAAAEAAEASRINVARLIDYYVRRRVAGKLRTAKEIEARLKRALNDGDNRKPGDSRDADPNPCVFNQDGL